MAEEKQQKMSKGGKKKDAVASTSASTSASQVKPAAKAAARAVTLEQWVRHAKNCLQIERSAELDECAERIHSMSPEDAEQSGSVLLKLRIGESFSGLFGRTVLELKHMTRDILPAHKFTVGDVIQVVPPNTKTSSDTDSNESMSGIVSRVTETSIKVALDDIPSMDQIYEPIKLHRLVNDATYKKVHAGLDQLFNYTDGPASHVINVMFRGAQPAQQALEKVRHWTPFNSNMNTSQRDAISFALASKDIALIHGPPGTGKTTTVVEFIQQLVEQGNRALVCAPSNVAVDNVLAKLVQARASSGRTDKKNKVKRARGRFSVVRVGHPARMLPEVLEHCLDARIETAHGTEIIRDIRKEMESNQRKLLKNRNRATQRAIREELKFLRKDLRKREEKVVNEIISNSDVVFTTNVGAASRVLRNEEFDVVIIDEAAQALEATCWIPIIKGKRCVLAGDPCQLPPTVKSKEAERRGLGKTLFDRLLEVHSEENILRMLNVQYRMHKIISTWASEAMYKGQLESHESVATRRIADIESMSHVALEENPDLGATMLLIDTAGCDMEEAENGGHAGHNGTSSRWNDGEVTIVAAHVRGLVHGGLPAAEIAVITPYNAQVACLKNELSSEFPTLEIRSVDGFQGCEKEAVVLSFVRSNARREVGFLADDRRINVAVTRAKRHCAVICDSETVSSHKFLATLVEYIQEHGDVASAEEFVPAIVSGETQEAQESSAVIEKQKTQKVDNPPTEPVSKCRKEKKNPEKSSEKVAGVKISQTTQLDHKNVNVNVEEDGDENEESEQQSGAENAFEALGIDSSSDEEDESLEEQTSNALLKQLHSQRVERHQTHQQSRSVPTVETKESLDDLNQWLATSASSSKGKAKRKKNKRKSKKKTSASAGEGPQTSLRLEEEHDFLKEQVKQGKKCYGAGCKESTVLMGSVCMWCKHKFCFKHAQAEVHGCGRDAKNYAQGKYVVKNGVLTSSAGSSKGSSMDSTKRKEVHKLLQKKIHGETEKRSSVSKSNKKK